MARFFNLEEEKIEERTLNIGKSGRSAKEIFEFVRESLEVLEINFDGLVCQTFDGASVMSGERGGLQAIICSYCKRVAVYIHCFCHRIHLVVTAVIIDIVQIKEHFETVSSLYTFFKLSAIKELYGGESLKRFIESRWSGQCQAANAISNNYNEIIKTLSHVEKVRNKKITLGDRALACGLSIQAKSDRVIFLNHLVLKILKYCDIANKILQSSKESLTSALTAVESVREEIRSVRESYDSEKIAEIIENERANELAETSDDARRSGNPPPHLQNFVITDTLPMYHIATSYVKSRWNALIGWRQNSPIGFQTRILSFGVRWKPLFQLPRASRIAII